MPGEFKKLYQELSRKTPDSVDLDLLFERERIDLFKRLGYKLGNKTPDYVMASSHHGKLVRARREEKDLWQRKGETRAQFDYLAEVNSVKLEASELAKITREMQQHIDSNTKVPRKLVKKLDRVLEMNEKQKLKRESISAGKPRRRRVTEGVDGKWGRTEVVDRRGGAGQTSESNETHCIENESRASGSIPRGIGSVSGGLNKTGDGKKSEPTRHQALDRSGNNEEFIDGGTADREVQRNKDYEGFANSEEQEIMKETASVNAGVETAIGLNLAAATVTTTARRVGYKENAVAHSEAHLNCESGVGHDSTVESSFPQPSETGKKRGKKGKSILNHTSPAVLVSDLSAVRSAVHLSKKQAAGGGVAGETEEDGTNEETLPLSRSELLLDTISPVSPSLHPQGVRTMPKKSVKSISAASLPPLRSLPRTKRVADKSFEGNRSETRLVASERNNPRLDKSPPISGSDAALTRDSRHSGDAAASAATGGGDVVSASNTRSCSSTHDKSRALSRRSRAEDSLEATVVGNASGTHARTRLTRAPDIRRDRYLSRGARNRSTMEVQYDPTKRHHSHSRPGSSARTGSEARRGRKPASVSNLRASNKWGVEERGRINQIYWELPLPNPRTSSELWRLYFLQFADLFRAYFPERSQQTVVRKIQDMIAKRQLKERGEKEYWEKNEGSFYAPSVAAGKSAGRSAAPPAHTQQTPYEGAQFIGTGTLMAGTAEAKSGGGKGRSMSSNPEGLGMTSSEIVERREQESKQRVREKLDFHTQKQRELAHKLSIFKLDTTI